MVRPAATFSGIREKGPQVTPNRWVSRAIAAIAPTGDARDFQTLDAK
jgi:hypothetical protein